MPVTKILFKPGVNKEVTSFAAQGGFYNCDKIRFRSGFVEKIGGWINYSYNNTFYGVGRTLISWSSYSPYGYVVLGFGTNQKYYVEYGNVYYDITPLRTTTLLAPNPIVTNGTDSLITINAIGHGVSPGTFVTITGATAVGTYTVSGEYEVITTPDGDSFTISCYPTVPTAGTGGGTNVRVAYQINAGNNVVSSALGWGNGPWGGTAAAVFSGYISGTTLTVTTLTSGTLAATQTIGGTLIATGTTLVSGGPTTWTITPAQTVGSIVSPVAMTSNAGTGGWGQSGGTSTITQALRLWSQCNFNQDLLFSTVQGPIYYWVFDSTFSSRGVLLSSYVAGQVKGKAAVTTGGTSVTSIVVDNNYYITQGATVTISSGSGGSSIPVGTKVTTAYNNGFTVTLSAAVTLSAGDVLNFSYSGEAVPTQTNRIISASTYQFTIALGANSYDPTLLTASAFNPMLVRWCDQSNAYEWVPQQQNQAGEQLLSNGSYLVTAVNTRQEIVIWSDSAMYSMQYVGAPYVFSFNLLQDNISIISPNAAISTNNATYFMGIDRFYVYDGSVKSLPCTLRRYVYSNLNKNQLNQIVAGYNEGYNEIWWFYPSATSQVNDSYIIYNYLDDLWYYGTMNRTAWSGTPLETYPLSMFSLQKSYISQAINATATSITVVNGNSYPSTGTITIDSEQIDYTIGPNDSNNNTFSGLTRGANGTTAASHSIYAPVNYIVPNQVLFHENGLDDASISLTSPLPINAYIETADVAIADGHNFAYVWRVLPDLTFTNSTAVNPSVTLTIEPRQNSGTAYAIGVDTMTVTNTVLPAAPTYTYPVEQYTGEVFTRVRGRQMAMRIESTGLGVQWQMGAMRFDIAPDGRR